MIVKIILSSTKHTHMTTLSFKSINITCSYFFPHYLLTCKTKQRYTIIAPIHF